MNKNCENSENSRKFPTKFSENLGVFQCKHKLTERKSIFVLIKKQRQTRENFRKTSRKFSKFRKFTKNFRGSFSRKLPENSRKTRGVFNINTTLQRENHYFYFYKSEANRRKLHEKFQENFRNVKNSRKKFPRKISRKFRVFFSRKYNATERKSIFSCL